MKTRGDLGPRGLAILLLAVTASVGMVSGVALDRLVLRPDAADAAVEPDRDWVPMLRDAPERRPALRGRYIQRVAEELDLTPEQRQRLDSLLTAQQERTRAVMGEVQPRLREIVRETRQGVEAILTPEQRERLRELRPMERRPGTRDRDRPRGRREGREAGG